MSRSESELQLVLVRFLYDELGVPDSEPFEFLKREFTVGETTTNPTQTEYRDAALRAFSDSNRFSPEEITQFDRNINNYLSTINEYRASPLRLRYYQYLAVFFTEVYLQQLSLDETALMNRLNEYIRNQFVSAGERNPLTVTAPDELRKVAYWMATGSGKTYIAHINYHQFRKHLGRDSVENIVLIAPREQIARQHVREFASNGIDAARINDSTEADILVTDFGKLDKDQSGPKTVDIDEYQGANLVFVDEGHKGLGSIGTSLGTGWTQLRDELAGDGYLFEYSATYGAAIKEESGYQEYSRSILFDYPYGRYHADNYGKDFSILNIEASTDALESDQWHATQSEWLLLNTLSYYEKLRFYEHEHETVDEYNLPQPLSVFVGGRVTKARTQESSTDIQRVLEFFSRVLRDDNWAVSFIRDALSLATQFHQSASSVTHDFPYLRQLPDSPSEMYLDMIERLFDASPPATLEIQRLNNGDGEIGIKVRDGERFFGLITIGDDAAFIERVEGADYDAMQVTELETFTGKLFDSIDAQDSPIRFLIGSKKFTEGWDSPRPVNMGLLNLGQSKGPATVQMFGRGVRLPGKEGDGKRDPFADDDVALLERLHVFGLRSTYIEEFRDSLEAERTDTRTTEIRVPVKRQSALGERKQTYYRPTTATERETNSSVVHLANFIDNNLDSVRPPRIDLSFTVEGLVDSGDDYALESYSAEGSSISFANLTFRGEPLSLDALDWNRIHTKAVEQKHEDGLSNVVISRSIVQNIIRGDRYDLVADETVLSLDSVDDFRSIEEICAKIVVEWARKAQNQTAKAAERTSVDITPVDGEWLETVVPEQYRLRIEDRTELGRDLVKELTEIDSIDDIRDYDKSSSLLLVLTHYYYKPIALGSSDNSDVAFIDQLKTVRPEGLNRGERMFITQLNSYFEQLVEHPDVLDAVALRNPSRDGIGFRSAGGYYPDFVIWVVTEQTQHIIFADPKGILHGDIDANKQKIRFGEDIKSIEVPDGIELHSYLLARTDGANRSESAVLTRWQSFLEEHYEGNSDRDRLRNANVYFLSETNPQARAIIEDATGIELGGE